MIPINIQNNRTSRIIHRGGGYFVLRFIRLVFAVCMNQSIFITNNSNKVYGAGVPICYMYYALADNNLEYFMRQDLFEFIVSPAIQNDNLISWVYFDGRNINHDYDDITEPLQEVYNADGTAPTAKYEGSQYLTYDHTLKKMIIDTQLEKEQNGDVPQTIINFMTRAVTDCISKGTIEYMMIFSSHGGGFFGYGGDEHDSRRRILVGEFEVDIQRNQDIVYAINTTFNNISGAPKRLNVLGFDSCIMNDFGALDEYGDISEYFMASEATEPGHGWAYFTLNTTDSALDIAKQLYQSFLEETQSTYGIVGHQTPKTLAIVETAGYSVFLTAWEALSIEMKNILDSGNDPSFVSFLSRARGRTISFPGYTDNPLSQTPSLMDIGQFMVTLDQFCNIVPNSTLRTVIDNAKIAYDNQYVVRGVGPGTPNATGMVIFWPFQQDYISATELYDNLLFNTSNKIATGDAPNWLAFLKTYYNASLPTTQPTTTTTSTSVCLNNIPTSSEPTYEGQLFLNPEVSMDDNYMNLIFKSEVTIETDYVSVLYGVNATNRLYGNTRRMQEKIHRHLTNNLERRDVIINHKESNCDRVHQNEDIESVNRRTQGFDHYYIFGGNMLVDYDFSTAVATWDRFFYFLITESTNDLERIFVKDEGHGSKSFPVCYFDPKNPISSVDLEGFVDTTMAKFRLGCREGKIVFSTTQGLRPALYVYSTLFGTYSELPSFVGGQIAPISYVELVVGGNMISEIVGGFYETILDWGSSDNITIVPVFDGQFEFADDEIPSIIIQAAAFDFDSFSLFGTSDGVEIYMFEYVPDALDANVTVPEPGSEGTSSPNNNDDNNDEPTSAKPGGEFSPQNPTTNKTDINGQSSDTNGNSSGTPNGSISIVSSDGSDIYYQYYYCSMKSCSVIAFTVGLLTALL